MKIIKTNGVEATPYNKILDNSDFEVGFYRLTSGERDNQSPHVNPEIYFVLSWRATFWSPQSCKTGIEKCDVIYVEKLAEHRFEDITEDLTLLVIFSKLP